MQTKYCFMDVLEAEKKLYPNAFDMKILYSRHLWDAVGRTFSRGSMVVDIPEKSIHLSPTSNQAYCSG